MKPQQVQQIMLARWRSLSPRDRRAALLAAGALALLLVWLLAVQPAWRTLREAPAQIDALDAQLQKMQRLATESKELRATPRVPVSQSTAALQAATGRLGDKGRLVVAGDRATLTLTGATGEQLRDWLLEARSAARARPVEAQLTRGPTGYSGSVVVTLGGGGA